MNKKVSIIVPVYNVEKYLKECIESLINQTYKNIEILLIDDGSTDNSKSICDNYSKKYEFIYTIHKKNGGLSSARNLGIETSKGDYLCFVDSDDFVSKDYVESMLNNLVKHSVLISACGMCHYYDNGRIEEYNFQNIDQIFIGDDAQIYLNVLGYYNVSAANKLFSRDLFKSIKFPLGFKSEDWFVMYKLIEKAGSIYYNSNSKYYYRQRIGSITHDANNVNTDSVFAAKEVYNYFFKNEKVKPYAAQSLFFTLIGIYNNYLYSNRKIEMNKVRKNALEICNDITYDKISKSRIIQAKLFCFSSIIYNIIFKVYLIVKNIKNKL